MRESPGEVRARQLLTGIHVRGRDYLRVETYLMWTQALAPRNLHLLRGMAHMQRAQKKPWGGKQG